MWGKLARRVPKIGLTAECLVLPDGDNLELHHLTGAADAPHVLLLHGLEGSTRSHYVGGLMARARSRNWSATLMLFRGCGTAPNVARRFYHSGETADVAHAFATLSARWPNADWCMAGVSLGGNVLLKWLGEQAEDVAPRIRAAVAVSVPFDLEAGAQHIARGFARLYDHSFLRSLRQKARGKLDRYPDLFDRSALNRARHVHDFDDVVTAPVHGFANARDYYQRSSSMQFLRGIRVPTLLLSSRDDPFLPPDVLARAAEVAVRNANLQLEVADRGGHVGFVSGPVPWKPFYYAEWRAFQFFDEVMEQTSRRGYD